MSTVIIDLDNLGLNNKIELIKTVDLYIYKYNLPGYSKEYFNVVVDNNGYINIEIPINCARKCSIPLNIQICKLCELNYDNSRLIKAVLSKGILTITVPRKDYSYVVNITED